MSPNTPSTRTRARLEEERSVLEIQVHSRHFVRWKGVLVAIAAIIISVVAATSLMSTTLRETVAIVGTLSFCIVILMRPEIGFWCYYFLGFARPNEVFWGLGDLRMSLGLAAVTLLSYLLHTAVEERPFLRRDPILYCMLALNLLVVFSFLVNGVGQERMVDLTKIFLFGVAFATWMDRRDWLRVSIRVLTFSFAFLTIWAAQQKFMLGVYNLEGPGSASSLLKDRNFFAMVLAMGIPFYYYTAMRSRYLVVRLGWLALVPLAVTLVFATASRGGLLGVGGVCAMIAWQTRYRVPALLIGAVLFLGFYSVAAPESLKSRTSTIVNYEGEDSAEGRIDSWKAGTSMMIHNPLVGVGPGNYVDSYSRYSSTHPRQAHNSLVQAAGEYGVGGPLLVLLFQYLVFRRLLRLRDDPDSDEELVSWARTLMAAEVGFWICGFFLSAEGFEVAYYIGTLTVILTVVMNKQRELLSSQEEVEEA
jgi:probable O-glycosylation ligase (exosortase A-associated)